MKINFKIKPFYLYLSSGIFFILLITILTKNTSINKNRETEPVNTATSSVQTTIVTDPKIVYDVNPVEETKEWNDSFKANLEYYKANRNPVADKNLSELRLNSPTIKTEFRVEYDYSNSTYTITLQKPYDTNKELVLKWFDSLEITQKMRDEMRIKWVNSEP
jgi:hypothetical protein